MRIRENWRDIEFSKKWDLSASEGNPARGQQLDMLVQLIKENYQNPDDYVLDLGYGSGLVEELIYRVVPSCRIVGIDNSPAMMELAVKRLERFTPSFESISHDLSQISHIQLPKANYKIVFSVQTIHNLPDAVKKDVFTFIYKLLPTGGLFIIMDRIAVEGPEFYSEYRALWKQLEQQHQTLISEGETYQEYQSKLQAQDDHPITLKQHFDWLGEAGFQVACLHLHTHRALIAARKTR